MNCKIFFFIPRTSIQCGAWCSDYDNCNAFKWDDTDKPFVCTLMSGYGLCLDKDEENPIKVFVDQAKVPTRCKGNTSYEYRLLYLQRGDN